MMTNYGCVLINVKSKIVQVKWAQLYMFTRKLRIVRERKKLNLYLKQWMDFPKSVWMASEYKSGFRALLIGRRMMADIAYTLIKMTLRSLIFYIGLIKNLVRNFDPANF